jgi:hypothetical protein
LHCSKDIIQNTKKALFQKIKMRISPLSCARITKIVAPLKSVQDMTGVEISVSFEASLLETLP